MQRPQDYDVYAPGADLRSVVRDRGSRRRVSPPAATDKSLTAGCGLNREHRRHSTPAGLVRRHARSRSPHAASASEPLAIYEMNAGRQRVREHPGHREHAGLAERPARSQLRPDRTHRPTAAAIAIIFASTRGNLLNDAYDYQGPQRTPADPSKGNSNLYVLEANPQAAGQHRVRQLTFLLNMERQPSMMADGRVIFTAEKRAPQFYQLALRRINLDGGDYHPLYAQRGSVAYPEATSVVELADKDFAAIFRDPATPAWRWCARHLQSLDRHRLPQLAALGLPRRSRRHRPVAAPVARSAVLPATRCASPTGAANAHPGQATSGVYASPATLPSGQLLVSFWSRGGSGGIRR